MSARQYAVVTASGLVAVHEGLPEVGLPGTRIVPLISPEGDPTFQGDYTRAVEQSADQETDHRAWLTLEHLLASTWPLGMQVRGLDLGCGSGLFCRNIEEFSKGRVKMWGIDVSLSSMQLKKHSRLFLYDGLCIPFHPDAFDFVVSKTVLEHLSPQHAVELTRDALIVAPHVVHSIALGTDRDFMNCDPTHRTGLRREGWRDLLEEASGNVQMFSEKWHHPFVCSYKVSR